MPIIYEPNSKRKAHRVQVPLTVLVEGERCQTADWSMTGVGLIGLKRDFRPDEEVQASLILPLAEAKIELPVTLHFKNERKSVNGEKIKGFAFAHISERNKKVLKEFLEHAIEGKLDHTDTLLDIYREPVINSPLQAPVVLADEEHEKLKKSFHRRSMLFLVSALLLFLTVGGTIFYNMRYLHETVGTVTGNVLPIHAPVAGKVAKVTVKEGQSVTPGTLLFLLDDTLIRQKIASLQARLEEVQKAITLTQPNERTVSQPSHLSPDVPMPAEIPLLREKLMQQEQALADAKVLFQKHLIDNTALQALQDQRDKTSAKLQTLLQRYHLARQRLSVSLPVKKPDPTRLLGTITNLKLKIADAKRDLENRRIYSPAGGQIYALNIKPGEWITPSRAVMAIQTPARPFILCQVPSQVASDLKIGIPVEFYSPSLQQKFKGTVKAIGELAINPSATPESEIAYNMVPIKIEPTNPLTLPLNERVKVWIHRPLDLFSSF